MLGFCDIRLSVLGAQKYHRSSALLKNDLLSEKSWVLGAWVRAPGSLNPRSPKPHGIRPGVRATRLSACFHSYRAAATSTTALPVAKP